MSQTAPARALRAPARITAAGLLITPGIDFDAWAAMGRRITGISNSCAWCLGDWLVYGGDAFPDRYKTALAATSLDYQTLRNYAWVARRFEMSRRRDDLSFQHHAELASLAPAEQELWLSRAHRYQWSRNELRRRLYRHRRPQPDPPADDAVKLSVEVTRTRERRWRLAARAAEQTLSDWIAETVDAAADATLSHPPVRAEDEHGEPEPVSLST
jgi:hypothetical protein